MIAPALLLALLLQAPQVVHWTITAPPAGSVVRPGAKLPVTLTAAIAPHWHLYSLRKLDDGPIPTSITVPDDQPFRLSGPIVASAPLTKFDDTFQMDVESYSESAEFILPVEVATGVKPGPATLTLNARFQACDDSQCLPPRTVKLPLRLEVK